MTSKVIQRPITKIEAGLLPVIALLKNDQACVLNNVNPETRQAEVIYSDQIAPETISLEKLQEHYTGMAILVKPAFEFDKRIPKITSNSEGHWFWDAIRENLPTYRKVMMSAFFINLFAVTMPLFIMNVYDRVVPNYAVETLWMLAAGVIIVLLMDITFRTVRAYFLDLAARRIDIKLSAYIMERVLGMRLEHRPTSVGSFAVNLRSFETVRDFITSTTLTTFIDLPFALIFLAVIAWIAWPVMIPIIIGLLIALGYAFIAQGKMKKLTESTFRASAMRNSTLIESLVGLETIKAIGAESRMQRKWEDTTAYLAKVGVQLRMLGSSSIHVTQWTQQLAIMFVVVTGVYLISSGYLSMGGLIACTMLTSRTMAPFGQLAGLIVQYHNAKIALTALDEIMAKPLERPEGTKYLSRGQLRGQIEFKKVSFQYPGTETPSLNEVSFRINPGEHVAILGTIGSGKSTLEKLAMGLYQPNSGEILIDGIDIRQLDPAEVKKQIGYVPQDPVLFYGTLRENLTLSQSAVSDEALVRALEIANLAEFINRHPQGIDMVVGERGDSLSGGQRKSVALARGVIHAPPILLMDEPTGSMDHSTEMAVKRQLQSFIKGRTFIVATHRNAFLDLATRIIVIDKGRIVADGPRDSVVEALRQGKIGKSV